MLQLTNVSAGYRRATPVVHEVSLEVQPGEAVGIVGRNGAGKTCLARCLMGVGQHLGGTITVDGRRIDGRDSAARIQAGLALVPEGRMIFGQLTVTENLRVAAYGARRSLSRSALEEVRAYFPVLATKADDRAGSLSGGEQQWLTIARALVQQPKVIVLDEPSLGLSPIAIAALGRVLATIKSERGLALVVMEQSPELLRALCRDILVLDRGRILESVLAATGDERLANVILGDVAQRS